MEELMKLIKEYGDFRAMEARGLDPRSMGDAKLLFDARLLWEEKIKKEIEGAIGWKFDAKEVERLKEIQEKSLLTLKGYGLTDPLGDGNFNVEECKK